MRLEAEAYAPAQASHFRTGTLGKSQGLRVLSVSPVKYESSYLHQIVRIKSE